jgi:hypothetical protein
VDTPFEAKPLATIPTLFDLNRDGNDRIRLREASLSPCLLAIDGGFIHLNQPRELVAAGPTMARRNLWSHDHAVL